jgi:hypothetical protein
MSRRMYYIRALFELQIFYSLRGIQLVVLSSCISLLHQIWTSRLYAYNLFYVRLFVLILHYRAYQ